MSGLVKRYRATAAVDGLNLVAAPGAVTALLGPNGAGKTSTVECCEGLRRADAGEIRVLGLDPWRDARVLRPRVGVMLQDGGLPAAVPALRALRHVAAMYTDPDLPELVDRLGLDGFARIPVRRLSGGQRQRLALAAALVGRPRVAFLDEPGAGLDPQARLAVWDLIREVRERGVAVVLTTHQMAEAEALADHVVIVDHGRTIAAGTVADLAGTAVRLQVRPSGSQREADRSPREADPALMRSLTAAVHRFDSPMVTPVAGGFEVHRTPDPELLHAITDWARSNELLITSLAAGNRSLEEVFLELTGRRLR